MSTTSKTSYYGIFIPAPGPESDEVKNVYLDITEALKALRKHKEGRLKVFDEREDAIEFSLNGFTSKDKSISQEDSVTTESSPSALAVEKLAFKAPKSQELVLFRKDIENGNLENVKKTIWDNPRYLIGLGDTPSILKEGTRYNSIHVTALHKQSKICEFILETISNVQFIQLLHGKKNLRTCQDVSSILLDLYLNMPEKGRSDTPLHLAVKYGAIEVVKVLTSYPQCKMTYNSDKLLPSELICSRMNDPPKTLINDINLLLQDRYYVPVIRSVDSSVPPVIGEPFSSQSPPNLNKDPLSPEVKIEAYAGPMNKDQAYAFRKRWKTPPRLNVSSPTRSSSFFNNSFQSPLKFSTSIKLNKNSSTPIIQKSRRLFPNKSFDNNLNDRDLSMLSDGIEPIEETAQITETEFKLTDNDEGESNWLSFLFSNTSLNDLSGGVVGSRSFHERNTKLVDIGKGLESIGRTLAQEQNVGWKEYWNFLGTFADFSTAEGLKQLEVYLESRSNNKNAEVVTETVEKSGIINSDINDLCSALQEIHIRTNKGKEFKEYSQNHLANKLIDDFNTIMSSPKSVKVYRCVEKSCQTFAQRFIKTFTNSNNQISTNFLTERLDRELKRLRSLILSYNGDFRFWNVNFKLVHSRFASLIVAYLKKEAVAADMLEVIVKCLNNFKLSHNLAESDLDCVCAKLKVKLLQIENIDGLDFLITEKACEDAWKLEIPCDCDFLVEAFKPSKRHNRNKSNDVSRKLFEYVANEATTHIPAGNTDNENLNGGNANEANSIWALRDNNINHDSSDDDIFLTGSEKDSDEDEEFFTPPESFVDFNNDDIHCCDRKYVNEIYILGDKPTKTDVDVLNVIRDLEIDEDLYPCISKWRSVVVDLSSDELESIVSSPMVTKKKFQNISISDNCPLVLNNSPVINEVCLDQLKLK